MTGRGATALAAAMTLVLGAGSMVMAQDEPVVYSGCLSAEGDLSMVAAGEEPLGPCDKSQQLAWWNQAGQQGRQGAQGEPGPQGEQGEKGDKGKKGDPGTAATYFVTNEASATGLVTGNARCDEGDLVTGGGYRLLSGPPVSVIEDYPSGARAWTISMLVADGSTQSIDIEIYAVCSDLEPLR